ncbi:MAG: hypothetical protein JRH11_12495 [Deltaproteobacteria bacterium]|nr:hypothetical protein [Deltaproteobacteria bacterium]
MRSLISVWMGRPLLLTAVALAVPVLGACSSSGTTGTTSSAPSSPSPLGDPTAAQASPPIALAPSSASRVSWGFGNDAVGTTPDGFTVAAGRWEVALDATRGDHDLVLRQVESSADDVFNVALVDGTSFGDLDVSVRLRSVAGRIDQGGGVVWRARDPRNYYITRYNPLEDNVRVYQVSDGRRTMIESASPRLDHAAWHTLRVTMVGDHIECFLDGQRYLDSRDTTFTDAGQVGLWTKADAQTLFDDLTVRALGEAGD